MISWKSAGRRSWRTRTLRIRVEKKTASSNMLNDLDHISFWFHFTMSLSRACHALASFPFTSRRDCATCGRGEKPSLVPPHDDAEKTGAFFQRWKHGFHCTSHRIFSPSLVLFFSFDSIIFVPYPHSLTLHPSHPFLLTLLLISSSGSSTLKFPQTRVRSLKVAHCDRRKRHQWTWRSRRTRSQGSFWTACMDSVFSLVLNLNTNFFFFLPS
jgi:hypothetical protein